MERGSFLEAGCLKMLSSSGGRIEGSTCSVSFSPTRRVHPPTWSLISWMFFFLSLTLSKSASRRAISWDNFRKSASSSSSAASILLLRAASALASLATTSDLSNLPGNFLELSFSICSWRSLSFLISFSYLSFSNLSSFSFTSFLRTAYIYSLYKNLLTISRTSVLPVACLIF